MESETGTSGSTGGGWSESAERLWIRWTIAVSVLWAVWYLTLPTLRSLLHLAEKIGRRL
jgi:hypothetical protein